MRILAVNSGSSSLKFDLYFVDRSISLSKRISGKIDRIGSAAELSAADLDSGQSVAKRVHVMSHEEALRVVMDVIRSFVPDSPPESVDRVGFRIVHGGELFSTPVKLTDIAIRGLETLGHPAPLHNPPALATIRAAQKMFSSSTVLVGVFDTQFHHGMPEVARIYAIPYRLTQKYAVRRYGFHGMAHEYMLDRYDALTGKNRDRTNLITLQLGSGCSVCAIKNGKSVDTSMGFTPLEGLMMRTRSGDIDAGLVSFLAREERLDGTRMEEMLNAESGLAGVSGTDGDMRMLLATYRTNPRSKLSVDLFCYRIAKYIGSYIPVIGIPDAIIFGGGIGEMSSLIRHNVASRLAPLGVIVDEHANRFLVGKEGAFHESTSRVGLYTVSVDESAIIARDTAALFA